MGPSVNPRKIKFAEPTVNPEQNRQVGPTINPRKQIIFRAKTDNNPHLQTKDNPVK